MCYEIERYNIKLSQILYKQQQLALTNNGTITSTVLLSTKLQQFYANPTMHNLLYATIKDLKPLITTVVEVGKNIMVL
eukprot:UN04917